MRREPRLIGMAGVMIGLFGATACAQQASATQRQSAAEPPQGEQSPRASAEERQQPKQSERGDTLRYVLAYPTGEKKSSVLLVEKIVPAEVMVGQPYEYSIRVTNLTKSPVTNVVINERGQGIEVAMKPGQDVTQSRTGGWQFGTLAGGASETLVLRGVARSEGKAGSCLLVHYQPSLCTAVNVVNPKLELTKQAPAQAYSCDKVTHQYSVSNTGTGVARDVIIQDQLPSGLRTADGKQEVLIEMGDLEAGETKQKSVTLTPTGLGTFASRAMARTATDEAASQEVKTTIVQPELQVNVMGPEWQYPDDPVTYTVEVENTSRVAAKNTVVELQTSGTDAEFAPREVGSLEAGESKRFNVTLRGGQEAVGIAAMARGSCALPASGRATTEVRRFPALRLGTVDDEDPVRVGDTTTYTVTVKNQGDGAAGNVRLTADVPSNMSFVDAQGPTEVRPQEGGLNLGTVATLPPGETLVWKIQMRAESPGDGRFRTELESDFLRTPVPDEEPTRVLPQQP